MKGRVKLVIGGSTAALVAVVVGATAWLRMHEAEELSRPSQVHTEEGTNYVVRVLETTVGKTEGGYLVLVAVRFENPNPCEVLIPRDWFVVVDHNNNRYLASTTGTQATLVKMPPDGVVEKELLSFAVRDTALEGAVELKVGKDRWVMIKDDKPFEQRLNSGEFVSFRRRRW